MRCEQHKVRKSKLPEEAIKKMADQLKERYFTINELMSMAQAYGYKGSKEVVLNLFSVRGYLIAEETVRCKKVRRKDYFAKAIYKIVTEEDYKKYDEEVHKDAKRRLLATVSY